MNDKIPDPTTKEAKKLIDGKPTISDKDLIQYYEIQEERMAREIRRLRGVINQKDSLIKHLQNPEK